MQAGLTQQKISVVGFIDICDIPQSRFLIFFLIFECLILSNGAILLGSTVN